MTIKTIAYIDSEYCETLCALHGEARNEGIKENCALEGCDSDDCLLFEVLNIQSEDLACVEYCAGGHSFCGICGSDMEHGEEIKGDFALCLNCYTASVYVDGTGYVYVDSFGSMGEYVNCYLMRHDLGLLSTNRETTITAVIDDTRTRGLGTLAVTAVHAPMFPEFGAVLVLTDGEGGPYYSAASYFEDLADERDADDETKSALAEDLMMVPVALRDEIIFESK